jgi:hypothetical protein
VKSFTGSLRAKNPKVVEQPSLLSERLVS